MCIGLQSFEVLPLIKIDNNRLLTEKAKIIDHCYQANILYKKRNYRKEQFSYIFILGV